MVVPLKVNRADGCCAITIYKEAPIEFWIKLPLAPEELRARGQNVPDLYPNLQQRWDSNNKQWTWKVSTLDLIPEMSAALELTSRYQPTTATPMTVPSSLNTE